MPKIVVLDFAGTLVKSRVIEKANIFRARVLNRTLPGGYEHSHPKDLYKINNLCVEKLTGLKKGMKIRCRDSNLNFSDIPGIKYQNQVSTNLFQIAMFIAAKKYGRQILEPGMLGQLQRIRRLGYRLAIVSGVRTDIISGMLQIAKIPAIFDYIYGQPAVLGVSNRKILARLASIGRIVFAMGDKKSDLLAAKSFGAKTIFVSWGHPSGGEEKVADYGISSPKDLGKIIHD